MPSRLNTKQNESPVSKFFLFAFPGVHLHYATLSQNNFFFVINIAFRTLFC